MAAIDIPSGALVEPDPDGKLYGSREFVAFLKIVAARANDPIFTSGTTAQRPTRYVDVGFCWYDKTLGKPIWVNSINPIVWHDASGAVV